MAGAASQSGDANSSRAPGITLGFGDPWMSNVTLFCVCLTVTVHHFFNLCFALSQVTHIKYQIPASLRFREPEMYLSRQTNQIEYAPIFESSSLAGNLRQAIVQRYHSGTPMTSWISRSWVQGQLFGWWHVLATVHLPVAWCQNIHVWIVSCRVLSQYLNDTVTYCRAIVSLYTHQKVLHHSLLLLCILNS